ncbi:MAG TPA: hypothetical protein VKX39_00530 [Bryobacteraceae bacterium]|nr:hypothetical protein [Bryobacteraceae bacterium]
MNDLSLNPTIETFKISKALVQEDQMSDDLPFGSQGGVLIPYHFALDREYTIRSGCGGRNTTIWWEWASRTRSNFAWTECCSSDRVGISFVRRFWEPEGVMQLRRPASRGRRMSIITATRR